MFMEAAVHACCWLQMVCEDQSGSPENDVSQQLSVQKGHCWALSKCSVAPYSCRRIGMITYRKPSYYAAMKSVRWAGLLTLSSLWALQASGECESIQRRVARSLASVVMGWQSMFCGILTLVLSKCCVIVMVQTDYCGSTLSWYQ